MSGFVSAGASNGDTAPTTSSTSPTTQPTSTTDRFDDPTQLGQQKDAWSQARADLEAARRRREESQVGAPGSGLQDGGRSLYEVLQANKDAKQAAFEEAAKLKNQFRALDDDEARFLDEVLESTRAKEEEVRREERERLGGFRKMQMEADRGAGGEAQEPENLENGGEEWGKGRKRRKRSEGERKLGFKMRRTSEGVDVKNGDDPRKESKSKTPVSEEKRSQERQEQETSISSGERDVSIKPSVPEKKSPAAPASSIKATPLTSLGLGGYGSEDDED